MTAIELSEPFVLLVVVMLCVVAFTVVLIPELLKHYRKVQKAETEAEHTAQKAEQERQRLDAFNEIVHKAQLSDLAKDCIAGRETWTETDDKEGDEAKRD